MTQEELYNRLIQEPTYLVDLMVANNLPALNKKAVDLQLSSSNLNGNQMFALFDMLAKQERYSEINQLINGIDYVPNQLPKGNDPFFFERFSPLMKNQLVGPPTEEQFWEQYTNAGSEEGESGSKWWTDFDWGGVLEGLGGVIGVFSNWGADGEETYTPPPAENPNNGQNLNTAGSGNIFSSDNLKTYGPWVAVAVLVLWLAYRKKL